LFTERNVTEVMTPYVRLVHLHQWSVLFSRHWLL